MSLFSFLNKDSGDNLVIFDVGSGSVGASLVTIHKGKAPRIEYVKRLPLHLKEHAQTKTILDSTLVSIKEISGDILKLKKNVRAVAIVLSSPWHISYTKSVSIQEVGEFTITPSFIDEIIEKEVEKMVKEEKDELELVEKRVANMKINGYTTASPYGKKAEKLDLSLYVSMSPVSFIKKVEEKIHEFFPVKNISHHSFPLASFSLIQHVFESDRDFIFTDIGGEITDVIAVSNGNILGTASFPIGKNHLVRKTADHFKIDTDLAVSFVKLFSENRASEDLVKRIGGLSDALREEWQAYFHQITKDIYETVALPAKTFVTTDEDVKDLFLGYIPEEFGKKVFLGNETLSTLVDFAPHVEHDSFLIIESIYLNSI